MSHTKIKKGEWENWLKSCAKLQHPIVPEKVSLRNYKNLIKKYVKGNKVLILGPTWQFRDMLTKMGFDITCVDISKKVLKGHDILCKVKKRKEKTIVADWLKFKPKQRYDLVIGDSANFQITEKDYNKFFRNMSSWLKPEGVSIQLILTDVKNTKIPLKDVVNFINKSNKLKSYTMKSYYYLGYHLYKNEHKNGNVAIIEQDLRKLVDKGVIDKKRFYNFDMSLEKFTACLLPRKKVENIIKKNLKIVKRISHGNNKYEDCFYWQYVMKKK